MSIEFKDSGLTPSAYYRFEAGALTTDSSAGGHTLTAIGVPAENASGKFGGAVDLGSLEIGTDIVQGLSNDESSFETYYWREQNFTPAKAYLNKVGLYLRKSGSPTGNLTIEIQTDNAGAPSGSVLATATLDVSTLTTSMAEYKISVPCTLTPATKYHICLKGQAAWDGTNGVYWAVNVDAGYVTNYYGAGNFTDGNHTTRLYKYNTYYSNSSASSAYSATDHADFKPTGAFTIGKWVKTGNTGDAFIFYSGSQNTNVAGIRLWKRDTGVCVLTSGNNTGTTAPTNYQNINGTTNIEDGNYHLVVGTWNGTHLNIYVDGVSDQTAVAYTEAPAYAATNYVRVGCLNEAGTDSNFFIGSLDDVFFLNGTALSAAQILNIYQNYVMAAAAGSFILTGQDATFSKALTMVAEAGSFVLTGMSATLSRGITMVAETGSFVLTGVDATFSKGFHMVAETGSFVLTGFSAILKKYRKRISWLIPAGINTLWTKPTTENTDWKKEDY